MDSYYTICWLIFYRLPSSFSGSTWVPWTGRSSQLSTLSTRTLNGCDLTIQEQYWNGIDTVLGKQLNQVDELMTVNMNEWIWIQFNSIQFKVDRLQIIVLAKKYIYVSQLFISRMPKMRTIPQLVSAPLNPIPIAEHFRRSQPPCEHSRGQHI